MSEIVHGQRKYHQCRYHGCSRAATCLPRLYVPAFQLHAHKKIEDCSILLVGFYLCDGCFPKLTAAELLEGERGRAIRDGIEDHFRKQGAHANFGKAVIGRVAGRDHDFGRSEDIEERRRAN